MGKGWNLPSAPWRGMEGWNCARKKHVRAEDQASVVVSACARGSPCINRFRKGSSSVNCGVSSNDFPSPGGAPVAVGLQLLMQLADPFQGDQENRSRCPVAIVFRELNRQAIPRNLHVERSVRIEAMFQVHSEDEPNPGKSPGLFERKRCAESESPSRVRKLMRKTASAAALRASRSNPSFHRDTSQ
jgi:hypothetical protein